MAETPPDLQPQPQPDQPGAVSGAPQSLSYFAPRTDLQNLEIPRRRVMPFVIVAALMLLFWVGIVLYAIFGGRSPREMDQFIVVIATTCGTMLLAVAALVLWLVWLYGVHRDLQAVTNHAYTIAPGMAVGFSCIPLFDAFWVVYMPWRMAVELNRHLLSRGIRGVPATAVLTCQILSILFALIMPGITVALYAVSMILIQRGWDRLRASMLVPQVA